MIQTPTSNPIGKPPTRPLTLDRHTIVFQSPEDDVVSYDKHIWNPLAPLLDDGKWYMEFVEASQFFTTVAGLSNVVLPENVYLEAYIDQTASQGLDTRTGKANRVVGVYELSQVQQYADKSVGYYSFKSLGAIQILNPRLLQDSTITLKWVQWNGLASPDGAWVELENTFNGQPRFNAIANVYRKEA